MARFNHVEELLKERGIQRYNQSGADLDVEVKGAHIAEFEHFLTTRARSGRTPRRYAALDHDVTVWMYLQRQRHQTTNALRSGALLLSNDYSLHAFDRAHLMNEPDGRGVATVVLPHHLLQVLRPFSRVTKHFDERFMEIFAAPEFRTTQTDYGITVSKVLAYLSSFEGVPTETAVHILNDDLLMGRLKDVETTDAEFGEAIESAVLKENSALVKSVSELNGSLSSAQKTAEEASVRVEDERSARQESERITRETRAAADEAVARAMQELAETQERQRVEAAERQASTEKAEQAAAEQLSLRDQLEVEQTRRLAAELALADDQRCRSRLRRRALAVIGGGSLIVLVLWGPGVLGWTAFERHPKRGAIQVLSVLALLGLTYLAAGGRHRGAAFTGIVLAAVIGIISLL